MIGPAARSGTPTGPDPRAFAPDRRSIGRAGWHRRTGLIPLVYLAGIIAIGFAHPVLAQWRWLGIHVLLLGAVTNAIVIWSAHFTAAVLHAPSPASRRGEALRLAGLNIGVLAVLAGGALDLGWIGVGGAGVVFAAICAHLYWLCGRLRATLPAPYRFTEQGLPYSEVTPLVRKMVATNPDRVLWATDWPHSAIFLPGGSAHQETWDPKPFAPVEYRGPFGVVNTNVSGVQLSERMAKTAQVMDKLVVCRSVRGFSS